MKFNGNINGMESLMTQNTQEPMEDILDALKAQETLFTPAGELHPNASISRSSIRPDGWNDEQAKRYYGKVYDTTGWTYLGNFSKLSIYERWVGTCACHEKAVMQCPNNDSLRYGALTWQGYYKTLEKLTEDKVEVQKDSGEPAVPKVPGKKGRAAIYKQVVESDDEALILSTYTAGATIQQTVEATNICQPAIRNFLADKGVLRARGSHFKEMVKARVPKEPKPPKEKKESTGHRGKVRTTNYVTPELVAKVAKMMVNKEGGGLVAIAKVENVNPNELSVALKAAGVVILRGKQKAA